VASASRVSGYLRGSASWFERYIRWRTSSRSLNRALDLQRDCCLTTQFAKEEPEVAAALGEEVLEV